MTPNLISQTGAIQLILADAAKLGMTLQAAGDKLRYKPKWTMTQAFKERVEASKPALLAYLSGGLSSSPACDNTLLSSALTRPDSQAAGVLSVLSLSTPAKGVWSQDELGIYHAAGKTRDDLPMAVALKDTFADWPGGVVLVSLEPDPCTQPTSDQPASTVTTPTPRQQAAQLIRMAKQSDRQHAINLRDAWEERMAICTIDGGLSEQAAMTIALDEIKIILS